MTDTAELIRLETREIDALTDHIRAAIERLEKRCTHYECRCARAAELAAMADRTGDPKLLAEAIAVHSQTVQCRRKAKQ